MLDNKYSLDLPYPELEEPFYPGDVKCIVDDYCGRTGEMTAVMQYLYQHYITANNNKRLSQALKGLALTEMRHHALLGEAIAKMGGDPIIGGSTCFWSGANVNYVKNPVAFLQHDIMTEKQAIANHSRAAACVKNPTLSELMLRIVKDEELHVTILRELLDELTAL
ncbi:MAG: manganese catalase family protein [Clostridia bacterium]|nr:manganese catalase family protein [Clostridia bacterium]MDE6757797.1 manganese catalase family protein [Clostridia bacterium]MDE7078716.1 manganese catalase family protein [Clostridia bacterium]